MSPERIKAERKEFEAWACKQPPWLVKDLQRDASGNYGHATAAVAWTILQARAAITVTLAASTTQKGST